jgi:hypothetical protein
MRSSIAALALAGLLGMTGCSSLVSIAPAVGENEAVINPGLLGIWTSDDGKETYVIRRENNEYAITYLERSTANRFRGRLFHAGNAELLDLVLDTDDPFQLQLHMILRVWPESSTMRIAFLDSEWLRGKAGSVASQVQEGRTIITAPAEAVKSFYLAYGADDRACGDVGTLSREN